MIQFHAELDNLKKKMFKLIKSVEKSVNNNNDSKQDMTKQGYKVFESVSWN